MSLHHQMDVYCERTDLTFWSEPLNAVTNVAFIVAGIFALRLYLSCQRNLESQQDSKTMPAFAGMTNDLYAIIMIFCLFAIGIGSFLFHTTATGWAAIADVAPIGLVIFTYHVATMHKIAGWNIWVSFLSLAMIPAFGWVAYQLPLDFMGSTKAYSPILPLLIIYFYYHLRRRSAEIYWLPLAFVTFSLSMATRIIDNHICDVFSYGVHWGWHILNAITLYIAFRAYAKNN